MDRTGKRLLVLALIFALLVGLGVYRFFSNMEQLATLQHTDEAVIAIKDIPARTTVTADMVRVDRLPAGTRHPNAATGVAQVVGKLTRQPIIAGEQALLGRLHVNAEQSGLSYQLAAGFRAVSVGINQKIAVAYQVRPGDHVDVVVSYELSNQNRDSHSVIMLQNIEVLAVGAELRSGTPAPPGAETITLAVRPEQAERLIWAEDHGKVRLMLRPVADKANVATGGATARTVPGER